MNMEFLYSNYVNTTTQIYVSTGTSTVSRLFDRSTGDVWQSSGDNSDLTTTTLSVEFATSVDVERIILQNINFKSFKIYYNSVTSSTFSLSGNDTTTTEWTGNSATNLYLVLSSSTNIDSMQIVATATIAENEEKKCGQLWITENYLTFGVNPSASQYKANIDRKEITHEMSDGGISVYVIDDKFKADITRDFIDESEYELYKSIRTEYEPFVFVPFPTSSSWDNKIYEVNWIGDFNFEQYADNYKGNGYKGTIRLRETPK